MFSVLVLDQRSTRVLSSALRVYDITQQGLSTVESLEKKRPQLKSLEAIYVIEPVEESIALLKEDFKDSESALYAAVHLYFIRKCPPIILEAVKSNPVLVSYLKHVAEINLDFLAVDKHVFHLDMEYALVDLFASKTGNSFEQGSLTDYKRERVQHEIVQRLVTLCATLNEYPYIQYRKETSSGSSQATESTKPGSSSNAVFKTAGDKTSEEIAKGFQNALNDFIAQNHEFWWNGDGKEDHGADENRGTVIILNRKEDLLAPLMHRFDYQQVIQDLLNTEDDVVRFKRYQFIKA